MTYFFLPCKEKPGGVSSSSSLDTENTGWRWNCVDLAWFCAWKRAPFHERPELRVNGARDPGAQNTPKHFVQSCVVLAWITRG